MADPSLGVAWHAPTAMGGGDRVGVGASGPAVYSRVVRPSNRLRKGLERRRNGATFDRSRGARLESAHYQAGSIGSELRLADASRSYV